MVAEVICDRMARFYNRSNNRRIQTYIVFGIAICFWVFVDLDHLVCIVFPPVAGVEEAIGCRLFHPYLLPVSGIVLGLSWSLLCGLWGYMVGNSIRRTS